MAAFNSMAHRLTNIPMTIENYNEEKNFIGRNNGYNDQKIKNILSKHHEYFVEIFKKHKIQLTTNSIIYKLRNQIKSTKNKVPNIGKSGVYEISCGTPGCEYKYIGESRRAMKYQFVEHLRAYKNNRSDSSAVAHQ
jgi:hypothetical protein